MTLTNHELMQIAQLLKSGEPVEQVARKTGVCDSLIVEVQSLIEKIPYTTIKRLDASSSLNQTLCSMVHKGLDNQSFYPPLMEHYRVGDIAKRIGVTKVMVRNYEDYGIIESYRDPENQYRYYDCNALWEANKLRSFRSMGFSLQESKELLVCDDIGRLVAAFQERIEALQESTAKLSALLQTVKNVEEHYERLKNDQGRCALAESPELLWLKHIQPGYSDEEALQTISNWTSQMPLVRIGVRYWVTGHCVRVEHGYCVAADVAESIHLPLCSEVKHLPSQKAIHAIIQHKSNMTTGWFKEDMFQNLYKYAREHHLKCRDEIVGIGIVALGNGADRTFYQDAWMPVDGH